MEADDEALETEVVALELRLLLLAVVAVAVAVDEEEDDDDVNDGFGARVAENDLRSAGTRVSDRLGSSLLTLRRGAEAEPKFDDVGENGAVCAVCAVMLLSRVPGRSVVVGDVGRSMSWRVSAVSEVTDMDEDDLRRESDGRVMADRRRRPLRKRS